MADNSKTVTYEGLAAYHDQLMRQEITPLLGPTVDVENHRVTFPTTARVSVEGSTIVFG